MTNENFENAQSSYSEKAKQAAADTAASMSSHVMGVLNDQLRLGAYSACQFASSMRVAAGDLQQENPRLAEFIRGLSHNVEDYSERVGDKTVEELARDASDFTRRQPALVFGLAALAGFFAFRTFKSAGAIQSPPIQPNHQNPAERRHG
jgi:hypothetical protein